MGTISGLVHDCEIHIILRITKTRECISALKDKGSCSLRCSFFKTHKIKDNLFTIFKICQSYDLPKTFRKLEYLKCSYSSKKPCLQLALVVIEIFLCDIRKYSLKLGHKEYPDNKVLYSQHCLWFLLNFFSQHGHYN